MDVKIFLQQYAKAQKYAEIAMWNYERTWDVYTRSPKIDGMPKAEGISNRVEEQAFRIEEARIRAENARDKALRLLEAVEDLIDLLSDYDEKRIIRLRYINGLTWDAIAQEENWSSATVRRIHGRALEKLRSRWTSPEKNL